MQLLRLGILVLLAAALPAVAQQPPPQEGAGRSTNPEQANCGIVYGEGHSFTICAPKGWTLDNGILNDQGIYAVFYPEGSNWDDAKESGTVMYVNVVGRPKGRAVAKMMADDAKEAKRNAPGTVAKQGTPIVISDVPAPVLRFAPGAFDRYEAVAYIGEEKVLVMIVISSKSDAIFNTDYPAFVQLVQSYKFLSSNVTLQH